MTQQDYITVLIGYSKLYGFEGGGVERVSREISSFNKHALLETGAKISLKLYAGGFNNISNQVELIRSIFSDDEGLRKIVLKTVEDLHKEKIVRWAVFAEQSLLCFVKLALLYGKESEGRDVLPEDISKVGHWLLILNDICMNEGQTEIYLPNYIEEELLRENITRQYFFMASERLPYTLTRFKTIFEKIRILYPKFNIDNLFFQATNGTRLDSYILFCFYLLVKWINTPTKEVDISKDWIVCKKRYFQETALNKEEIDKALSLLLVDKSKYKDNYQIVISELLGNNDVFPFNFLQLQQRPLISFNEDCFTCPSQEFLIKKATDGIYWILENYLKDTNRTKERDILPTAWGDSFEEYINEALTLSFEKFYISSPKKNDGSQLIDGLLFCENTLFIIEIKYAHWSYKAKLTGKKQDMIGTLNRILSSTKKVKGLGQITRVIKEYESGNLQFPLELGKRRIIPLVIVGEGMPIDTYNRKMYEELAKKAGSFYENDLVLPFIILDAEEVEILQSIAINSGVNQAEEVLVNYSQLFKKRKNGYIEEAMQFKNFLDSIKYPVENNRVIFSKFDEIWKDAIKKGFNKC